MSTKKDRTGEVRTMNSGYSCIITKYFNSSNISVQFEDGTVRNNVSYSEFKRGNIAKNKRVRNIECNSAEDRVGTIRRMNCGMLAEVVEYRSSKDVDIRFEDGLTKSVSWNCFINGKVGHPKYPLNYIERIGERRVMNCGMEAEVIAYRGNRDIDVRFEDGCTRNTDWNSFIKGCVSHPIKCGYARVGERNKMCCGMEAEIIAYHNSENIDIRFDNGIVRNGLTYARFKKGNIHYKPKKHIKVAKVGDIIYDGDKLFATIIRVNSRISVDISLWDGRVALGCTLLSVRGCANSYSRVLIPCYTFKGVQYYKCEYKGKRYLGTLDEIRSQLGT